MRPASMSFAGAIAYATVVLAVVVAANAGLYPGVGEAFPGAPWSAHPYRVAMASTLVLLAAGLGVLATVAGRELGNRIAGLAALFGGGILTGLALSAAPWTLFPHDQYPVTFMWLTLGAPTGLLVWLLSSALVRSPRVV